MTLYQGGQYFLYKYKRYDDLRLVFAPEADIAAFGGDPDNFQFPRWSLDFSILRAYENDKPADTPNYLQINFAGPAVNQLVFVAGHPGSTARLQTRAQLEFERDVSLPITLDAGVRAARPVHSVRHGQSSGRTHRAGAAQQLAEWHQGAPQGARCLAQRLPC